MIFNHANEWWVVLLVRRCIYEPWCTGILLRWVLRMGNPWKPCCCLTCLIFPTHSYPATSEITLFSSFFCWIRQQNISPGHKSETGHLLKTKTTNIRRNYESSRRTRSGSFEFRIMNNESTSYGTLYSPFNMQRALCFANAD